MPETPETRNEVDIKVMGVSVKVGSRILTTNENTIIQRDFFGRIKLLIKETDEGHYFHNFDKNGELVKAYFIDKKNKITIMKIGDDDGKQL